MWDRDEEIGATPRTSPAASVRATRGRFLARAAGAGGALGGLGLLAAGPADGAVLRGSPARDATILNFALFLEYVEEGLYAEAVRRRKLPQELAVYARTALVHERAHVALLQRALGSKARPRPRLQFGKATAEARAFTRASITLEDAVVAGYNGQAANLTPGSLAHVVRIVSVDARHAAWIRAIAGLAPALHPTDPLLGVGAVMASIQRLGFVKS